MVQCLDRHTGQAGKLVDAVTPAQSALSSTRSGLTHGQSQDQFTGQARGRHATRAPCPELSSISNTRDSLLRMTLALFRRVPDEFPDVSKVMTTRLVYYGIWVGFILSSYSPDATSLRRFPTRLRFFAPDGVIARQCFVDTFFVFPRWSSAALKLMASVS